MTNADDELLARPKGERPKRSRRRREIDQTPSKRESSSKHDTGKKRENDVIGRVMEVIARGSGTPGFLMVLSVFVVLWITWNSIAPQHLRFDSSDLGFTVLTLALSLQASYAAPMILLAQNRQDDRDRVQIEQDRQRTERNTADLEYLMREIVALRMTMQDVASKDFIRSELRSLLEDLETRDDEEQREAGAAETGR